MPSTASNGGPRAREDETASLTVLDRLAAIARELEADSVQADAREASARLADGGSRPIGLDELALFVDDRDNRGNAKGVVAVEVFLPVPLLATGLCLVDTPGLGSVFSGNTAVTRSFLPQVDAALVVLGSDPPITGEEADLLTEVAAEVRHVVVVLNKADRASAAEMLEARRFKQDVIERRLGRPVDALLEVSARERLETGLPTREWAALEQGLAGLARQSRTEILDSAGERTIRRLGAALLGEIAAREAALLRPLQATEVRVGRLREAASGTQRLLADLGALFAATEADLARRYEARRAAFAEHALPEALAELDRAIASGPPDGSLRARALSGARAIAERRVREFLADAEPVGEQLYTHATERFVTLTNALLREAIGEEGDPGPRLEAQAGFRKRRGFFFAHMMSRTHVGFWTWLGDATRLRLEPRARRHAREYLRELLHANTVRIVGDLRDRVLESRRSLEHELTQRLAEAVAVGDRALAAARERLAAGSAAVSAEIERLAAFRGELLATRTSREPLPASPAGDHGAPDRDSP